jgi:hypothetical protein
MNATPEPLRDFDCQFTEAFNAGRESPLTNSTNSADLPAITYTHQEQQTLTTDPS